MINDQHTDDRSERTETPAHYLRPTAAGSMLFSLFIAVLSLTGLASGTDLSRSAYDFAPVRSFILRTLAEKRVPSISVAVAKNGQILWEEAFGLADREKMTLATPQTIYSLASITKPFTATAVMELLEKQKIDLDRPINDYLGTVKLTGLAGDASAFHRLGGFGRRH